MSLYLDSESFFPVFLISLDFLLGEVFGFKVLNEFGFCVLVIFAGDEPKNRVEDIFEVLQFPWGKLGHKGMWKEGHVPLISFSQNLTEL